MNTRGSEHERMRIKGVMHNEVFDVNSGGANSYGIMSIK